MLEQRTNARHYISFPIRVEWKDEKGSNVISEGLTENISPMGALIHLPRHLPNVGSKVNLTVTEDKSTQVTVTAQVLRLERNAAHPQVAVMLVGQTKDWKKQVYEYAEQIINSQKPDSEDDWN